MLRVDISARQEPQVAVVALDELDAGDLGQPLRRSAVELQLDPPLLRGTPQRIYVAGSDDMAAVDDHDLLAYVLDELELMAGEEDGGSTRSFATKQLGKRLYRNRIETGERLVEDEQLRLVKQRCCELRTLLVAVRERLDVRTRAIGDAEPAEPVRGGCLRVGRRQPVQAAEVGELLADPHPRIEAALLGHVAEPESLGHADRSPVPERGAGVGSTSPKIVRIAVVFPAPFGPRKPSIRPRPTENVQSSRACTGPNRLHMP